MKKASQQGNNDPQLVPSISTSTLCKNLGINPYEQQDSQEFWKLLLPEIDCQELTNLYKGKYETYIAALDNTGREKIRTEVFLDLSLDVTNFDQVDDSLEDMFTSGEMLLMKEGNGWRPEKGAEKVDAIKGNKWRVGECSSGSVTVLGGNTISSGGCLPKILQLHLMRFNYDWQTGVMSKINSRFGFGKVLNLKGVCTNDKEDEDENGGGLTAIQGDGLLYDLQSIVVHAGEFGSGHYYAYVRPNVRENKWFRYDDDRVSQVSFKEVKDDAFGGHVVNRLSKKERQELQGAGNQNRTKVGIWKRLFGSAGGRRNQFGWGGRSSSAYMLQYVRRSDISLLYD
jgi:ubiquitin carboxyl-terminal hydrolase 7